MLRINIDWYTDDFNVSIIVNPSSLLYRALVAYQMCDLQFVSYNLQFLNRKTSLQSAKACVLAFQQVLN